MPLKCTFLIKFGTEVATDFQDSIAHVGSMSESHWLDESGVAAESRFDKWLTARALLLPPQATIQAVRQTVYSVAGGRLTRTATILSYRNFPGTSGASTDIPQIALGCDANSTGRIAAKLFRIRCIPDTMVTTGEYAPTAAYRIRMNAFLQLLIDDGWGWMGRDQTAATANVNTLAGGVITLSASIGVSPGDSIRLKRVRLDDGTSLTGTFLVQSGSTPPAYTLAGLPAGATITRPNGQAVKQGLKFYDIDRTSLNRITTQRVGRPFEPYVGRRRVR